MSPVEVDYLGEGASDSVIAHRLISSVGLKPGRVYDNGRTRGKAMVDRRLPGLNVSAARGRHVLVLRDLDRDGACPSALAARLLPDRHSNLLLRIPVFAAESWLLADHQAYAEFCRMPARNIPSALEQEPDLKSLILGWAAKGKARALRLHVEEGRRRAAPDWTILGEWHADFARDVWCPLRATESGRAPSLNRAIAALKRLVAGEELV